MKNKFIFAGAAKLYGTAPRRSLVTVVDGSGETVATTHADDKGKWHVERSLSVGSHVLRAVVPRGNNPIEGEEIEVTILESEAEITAADPASLLTAEERQPYVDLYFQYVEVRAGGCPVDMSTLHEILPWAGKTVDDFYRDAIALFEVNERLIALGADPNEF